MANAFDSKWKLILNYQKGVSGLAISEFSHTQTMNDKPKVKCFCLNTVSEYHSTNPSCWMSIQNSFGPKFNLAQKWAKTVLFLTLCYSQVTWCFQNMAEAKFLLYLVKIVRTKACRQLWMETSCDVQRKRWHHMIPESIHILMQYSAAKAYNEKLP